MGLTVHNYTHKASIQFYLIMRMFYDYMHA